MLDDVNRADFVRVVVIERQALARCVQNVVNAGEWELVNTYKAFFLVRATADVDFHQFFSKYLSSLCPSLRKFMV